MLALTVSKDFALRYAHAILLCLIVLCVVCLVKDGSGDGSGWEYEYEYSKKNVQQRATTKSVRIKQHKTV